MSSSDLTSRAKPKRRRSRAETRRTTPVDVQVGRNVRRRRIELGMSQTALAQACGITFQQIQKYENGANRVSASRLWQFAAVLGVQVVFFFEGLGSPKTEMKGSVPSKAERKIVNLLFSLFEDPKVLDEIRAALVHDFVGDYDKVMLAAKKAIALRREGDFILTAEIRDVQHGTILVTGQGLFLPVTVTGDANIRFSPQRR